MKTQDFDFDLPAELIAQYPAQYRTSSRLLYLNSSVGQLLDQQFIDLKNHLRSGDVMVFNDTRVVKARLFGHKESGGKVEVMVERVLDDHHVLAVIRASHAPKPGGELRLADCIPVMVVDRGEAFYTLRFMHETPVHVLLENYGHLPLPPYIDRQVSAVDESRYQTIYAKNAGAVAAPTAGLHFDEEMLARLGELDVGIAYVTLHVGAGTFQPVRVNDLAEHRMHTERYELSSGVCDAIAATRKRGGRVVAVGTTSLRALESAAVEGIPKVGAGETALFVTPGFKFRVADMLITNFHLPKSTLLVLVSAFAGLEEMRVAYRHAIVERYRFFSYGDAMLLSRKSHE